LPICFIDPALQVSYVPPTPHETSDGVHAAQKAGREAVAECGAAVADYRAGSERALNYIVGQVMKKTRGKADAGEVHRLVKEEVEKS